MVENIFSEKTVIMSKVMTPDMANFVYNVHGGHLLHLLDQVAYACAARYSSHNVVTLSVEQVVFKQPIFVGELVTFLANINFVGKTSMEVGIRVEAENLFTRAKRHTNTCYFTMVAVDASGKPTPVKPLEVVTESDKRRFAEAKLRKDLRLDYQEKLAKIKEFKP